MQLMHNVSMYVLHAYLPVCFHMLLFQIAESLSDKWVKQQSVGWKLNDNE